MEFAVIVTFDIKNPREGDYEKFYKEAEAKKLSKKIVLEDGLIMVLPTTTLFGMIEAPSGHALGEKIESIILQIARDLNIDINFFLSVNEGPKYFKVKPIEFAGKVEEKNAK